MRKIKEVLRLKWAKDLSNRQIARICGIGRPTVAKYLRRAEAAGLTWPLPAEAYVYAAWKKARVHIDYHVAIDGRYYSVTHALIKKQLDVRITAQTIECFHRSRRVASHRRSHLKGCLGLLIDREVTARENRRLRRARLKHNAALEDIDYRHPRGLDRALIQFLASCRWVSEHLSILITGPTGVGKTWLACALAQKACREGHSALYLRLPRLLQDMAIAKGDGRYPKLLATLAKTEVLILDDWGLAKLTAEQRRDLLEILEGRHGTRSTLATSHLTVDKWHGLIGDPTLACHPRPPGPQRLQDQSQGESMRKRRAKLTPTTQPE